MQQVIAGRGGRSKMQARHFHDLTKVYGVQLSKIGHIFGMLYGARRHIVYDPEADDLRSIFAVRELNVNDHSGSLKR